MSWSFGDKDKKPDKDTWMIKKGQKGSFPLFVRVRNSQPENVSTEDYPYLIGISWKYEPRDESGLPNSLVLDEMGHLEELLDKIEISGVAYLMTIVTGNEVREWLWYTRDPQEMMHLVNQALASQEPFPIKFIREDDPTWVVYKHWRNS